ncbi:MAG: DMT family transporter [Proteobacteria bacterium]|nr:DMT family transporter [Pseudomonadota bacterium]
MRRPSRGIAYMIASALGFSVMSVLVKLASPRIPTGEIVFVRALITLVISYALVRRAGLAPLGSGTPGALGRLALRGVLGFGGLAGYYLALAHLPIADATTLQNTVPLLTAGLAWWMLGEKVGWPVAIALVFGTLGVLLVVRPSGDGLAHDPVGVAAALVGAACSALAYVTVRKLARTEHPLVIVLVFPLVATPLAIPWAAMDFVVPAPSDVLLLLAIGVSTQIGQVFLTLGLAAERVASATSVNYLQVCFAMGWQVVVFGEVPAIATLVGAGAIILGTVLAASSSSSSRS